MTLGGERNRSTWHRILDNKKGSGFVLIPAHSINFCASYNSVVTSYLCICAPLYHRAGAVFKHVPSTVYCSLLHNNNKQLTTKTPLSPSILQPGLVSLGRSDAGHAASEQGQSPSQPWMHSWRATWEYTDRRRRFLCSTSKDCCSPATVSIAQYA